MDRLFDVPKELIDTLAKNGKEANVSAVAHYNGLASIWKTLSQEQKEIASNAVNEVLSLLGPEE